MLFLFLATCLAGLMTQGKPGLSFLFSHNISKDTVSLQELDTESLSVLSCEIQRQQLPTAVKFKDCIKILRAVLDFSLKLLIDIIKF